MSRVKPFFWDTLVLFKVCKEARGEGIHSQHRSRRTSFTISTTGMRWICKERKKEADIRVRESYIVRPQRDPSPATSTEFCLAVWAEVAAAIGKLGLATNAAGGSVILLLRLLTSRLDPNTTHFLFVALKLLVQCPVREVRKTAFSYWCHNI